MERRAVVVGDMPSMESAPPALTRTAAVSRAVGPRDGPDMAEVVVPIGEPPVRVSYEFDRQDRTVAASVEGGPRYVYFYDCPALPVDVAGGMLLARCRATSTVDGALVECDDDSWLGSACTEEIGTIDLDTWPGVERVLACTGNCEAPYRIAYVVMNGTTPVWAVHAGQDMACMSWQLRPSRGANARVRLSGGGEDGNFAVDYESREGMMVVTGGEYGGGLGE